MDPREHVVFHPTPSGRPGHTRTSSLEEALSVVERLRNDHGVTDVEVAALRPVPLAVRPYWVVEVASAASLPDDAPPDHAPDHALDPGSHVPPGPARRGTHPSPAGRPGAEALPAGRQAEEEPRVAGAEVAAVPAPEAAPVRDQTVVEDTGAAGGSSLHAAVPEAAGRTAAAHGASRPAAAPAPREPQEQEAVAPGAAATGAAAPAAPPEGRRERRGLGFFA